ncbi:MAG: cupin domain-containing protein [Firmicutes bacterium]|nr:cupin domain-containing protein [Alicyclobacillaceae bacterium]MCL6497872.1 cupin domain-containing protein [Bacillota bacterium]
MAEIRNIRHGRHYTVGEAGPLTQLDSKLFVGKALGFVGMEVSLNRFKPGQEVPFYHRHRRHEEMYLFIQGHGQFQVDDETFEVGPGTIVRVLPDGKRAWRNHSQEDLVAIVIQAAMDSLNDQDGIRLEEPVTWPE